MKKNPIIYIDID